MYTVNEDFRLKRMAGFVSGKDFLLDVGFAHMPNPFLKNKKIVGVDLECVELPLNYSEVFCGSIEEYSEKSTEGADAIMAGEILEHIEDPLSFLRGCYRALAVGGVLVLSTPNPNSPFERLLTLNLSRRFFYTDDHIFLFPQRWLIRVLERGGFEDVRLFSGGIPVPVLGTVPFPRPWCHQTIAVAYKK